MPVDALTPAEPADELIRVLRSQQRLTDAMSVVTTMGIVAVVLHDQGRHEAAARAFGWLNGRSALTRAEAHREAAAEANVETAVGDRWPALLAEGRSWALDQLINNTCEELSIVT